jgi:hypothetical protein
LSAFNPPGPFNFECPDRMSSLCDRATPTGTTGAGFYRTQRSHQRPLVQQHRAERRLRRLRRRRRRSIGDPGDPPVLVQNLGGGKSVASPSRTQPAVESI